jgi:hypothetical protein
MKKNKWMTLSLLLTSLISFGQSRFGDVEKFFHAVVFVSTERNQIQTIDGVDYEVYLKNIKTGGVQVQKSREIGTAFFVSKDNDVYLVTASHVARGTGSNTFITVSSPSNNPSKVLLKELIEASQINGDQFNWTTHPTADVAVLHLNHLKAKDLVGSQYIPYDWIYNELDAPTRQIELYVYGFPLGLGVDNQKIVAPISKKYNSASDLVELPRFDNHVLSTFFLIDDPSIQGMSGGPVISLPQNFWRGTDVLNMEKFWIFGLVHGVISNGGGGYGAIVPAKYIFETIALAPGYNGVFSYKYRNGKLWSEVLYKNGLPWTVMSNFDINGKPQEKGTLLDGNGTRYVYDEKGVLVSIYHLEKGIEIKEEVKKK